MNLLRHWLLISIAATTPLMEGCKEKKPIQPPPDLQLPAKSAQPIDVYVGRTHLRIPWNMIGHTYQSGFRQGGPRKLDGIAVIVYWPEMSSQVEAPGARGLDSLFIQINGFDEPQPFPWEENPEVWFSERTKALDGPVVNDQTGLREWHLRGTKQAVLFARRDSAFRVAGGRIPFASCPHGSAKVIDCNSGERVNEYLAYGYRFYKNNIADWPVIDDAVRSLISSLIVKEG